MIKEKNVIKEMTISGHYLVLKKHLLPSLRGKETGEQRS